MDSLRSLDMEINEDKLLRHCWSDEVVDDTHSLYLCETFREKEYHIIMTLLRKKVNEMESKSQSRFLGELCRFFTRMEWKGCMDMVTLEHLNNGYIYYNENDCYPTSEVDESKTESKIMEVVNG